MVFIGSCGQNDVQATDLKETAGRKDLDGLRDNTEDLGTSLHEHARSRDASGECRDNPRKAGDGEEKQENLKELLDSLAIGCSHKDVTGKFFSRLYPFSCFGLIC